MQERCNAIFWQWKVRATLSHEGDAKLLLTTLEDHKILFEHRGEDTKWTIERGNKFSQFLPIKFLNTLGKILKIISLNFTILIKLNVGSFWSYCVLFIVLFIVGQQFTSQLNWNQNCKR